MPIVVKKIGERFPVSQLIAISPKLQELSSSNLQDVELSPPEVFLSRYCMEFLKNRFNRALKGYHRIGSPSGFADSHVSYLP